MEFTTEEFSEKLGVDKDRGYGFLRFLEATGLAENLGPRKLEKQGGKGATVYRVKPDAKDKLGELMGKLG